MFCRFHAAHTSLAAQPVFVLILLWCSPIVAEVFHGMQGLLLDEELRAANEVVETALSLAGPNVTRLVILNSCDYADRCSKVMHSISSYLLRVGSFSVKNHYLAFEAHFSEVDSTQQPDCPIVNLWSWGGPLTHMGIESHSLVGAGEVGPILSMLHANVPAASHFHSKVAWDDLGTRRT
jgi:hypothetical protein